MQGRRIKKISYFIIGLKLIKEYLISMIFGFLQQNKFKNIKFFCLFIGYPRSGHSMIGALLDAHPEIVIAMEKDVIRYVKKGFRRNQLFTILIKNALLFKHKKDNIWTGYNYKVPDSWQGKYSTIKVIGDKKGGGTTHELRLNPGIIKKLEQRVGVPLKIIHVIRNPFDIITTQTFRKQELISDQPPRVKHLLPVVHAFLNRVNTIQELKESGNYEIFDLYHEEFIKNPHDILGKLLQFLEVEYSNEYINSCASIVYSSPNRSRNKIAWPQSLISYVESEIANIPFLSVYTFNN